MESISKKIGIVWHRRDLRIQDNLALHTAILECDEVIPLFIFDPNFFEKPRDTCDDRILFLFESIDNLQENYSKYNLNLEISFGKSLEVLKQMYENYLKETEKFELKIYFNADNNMKIGNKRDISVKHFFKDKTDIELIECQNDAIIRNSLHSRTNWGTYAEEFFNSKIYDCYSKLDEKVFSNNSNEVNNINKISSISKKLFLNIKSITTQEMIKKYNLKKQKKSNQIGGETYANERLEEFLKVIYLYPKSISKPFNSQTYCSRLSAYFSFGCISLKVVYQRVKQLKIDGRIKHFYITRLFWNQHFTQKLVDFKELDEVAVNPILRDINQENLNEELIKKYQLAQTGYPLVDASIQSLTQTGWINFRMRAMIASFFCFILHQPWKIGADFMAYHLMDCDVAINYSQWQMQAGVVGVHPLRIYNVTKQIQDNDSELEFIKQFLPIFKEVKEIEYICEPWKYKEELFEKYDIKLGIDYPLPIADFEVESRYTRLWFKEKMPEIRKALNLPEVKRNASLSKRKNNFSQSKSKKKDKEKSSGKNKSLLDFS